LNVTAVTIIVGAISVITILFIALTNSVFFLFLFGCGGTPVGFGEGGFFSRLGAGGGDGDRLPGTLTGEGFASDALVIGVL
jgi:hypothetical protein